MQTEINEVEINGVKYVRKGTESSPAVVEGLPAVIVSAGIGGIHFGLLKERKGIEVTLVNARRIQYWDGAASITEIANRGVSKPQNCRFSMAASEITLPNCVEILAVSSMAIKNLNGVPVWTR